MYYIIFSVKRYLKSSINRQAPLNGCIRVSVHITAIFALSTPLELAPRSIKCLFK